jgi:hypothetical protein
VTFTVDYKLMVPTTTWITYFYLERGVEATLTVNMLGVSKIVVLNRDEFTSAVLGVYETTTRDSDQVGVAVGTVNLHEIGTGEGWFECRVELKAPMWPWSPLAGVTAPTTTKQYAWMTPLKIVSYHDLTHNVSRQDHGFAAIKYPDSGKHEVTEDGSASVWLAVNDPTYPATGVVDGYATVISHPDLDAGGTSMLWTTGATGIFESDDTISKFYDLSYSAISEITDHMFVKVELLSEDPNTTPRVAGYSVRILN